MTYVSNKIKVLIDTELKNIRDDLLQLCSLKDTDIKKEIKLYFKNV